MRKAGRPLREDAVRIAHELYDRANGKLNFSELAILVGNKLGEEVHRKTVYRWIKYWVVTDNGIERRPLRSVAQCVQLN